MPNFKRFTLSQADLLMLAYFRKVKQYSYTNKNHVELVYKELGFVEEQTKRCLRNLLDAKFIEYNGNTGALTITGKLREEKSIGNDLPVLYPFTSAEFMDAFDEYLDHRKYEKKKPFNSNHGIQRCLNSLFAMADGNEIMAIRIISVTLDNNWLGLRHGKSAIEDGKSRVGNQAGKAAEVFTEVRQRFDGFTYGDG